MEAKFKEIFYKVDGESQFFINHAVGENLLTVNIVDEEATHNIFNLSVPEVKNLIAKLQKWVES